MAVKSIQQINQEIGTLYDPQINAIKQRQAMIPQQLQAEEAGLGAKQTQAFDEILGGARRRGLGFAGIPVGEQAKYNATEYMPALARLKQSGREQELNLTDAILGINERRGTLANQLHQTGIDNDYRERVFAEEKRRAAEALAESRRQAAASASSGNAWMSALGGGGGGAAAPAKTAAVNPQQVTAWGNIQKLFGQNLYGTDPNVVNAIKSDYLATARSAQNGNPTDLLKLQMYRQARPDLFKAAYSWEKSGGKYGSVIGARY